MDKLRRVLSGEDRTPEEESSIMTQVCTIKTIYHKTPTKNFGKRVVFKINMS